MSRSKMPVLGIATLVTVTLTLFPPAPVSGQTSTISPGDIVRTATLD